MSDAIVFIGIGLALLAISWLIVDHERRVLKLERELKALKDWMES